MTRNQQRILGKLRKRLSTDEGMAKFLDALFGAGSWRYDAAEDVWVIPDKDYTGPGRGFVVVKRGGDWFRAVIPEAKATI